MRTTGWKSRFLHAAQSRSETETLLWVPFSGPLSCKQSSLMAAFPIASTFFKDVVGLLLLASSSNVVSGEFTSEGDPPTPDEQLSEFFDWTLSRIFDSSVGCDPDIGLSNWGEK